MARRRRRKKRNGCWAECRSNSRPQSGLGPVGIRLPGRMRGDFRSFGEKNASFTEYRQYYLFHITVHERSRETIVRAFSLYDRMRMIPE